MHIPEAVLWAIIIGFVLIAAVSIILVNRLVII